VATASPLPPVDSGADEGVADDELGKGTLPLDFCTLKMLRKAMNAPETRISIVDPPSSPPCSRRGGWGPMSELTPPPPFLRIEFTATNELYLHQFSNMQ
jgi:hypothetical protein